MTIIAYSLLKRNERTTVTDLSTNEKKATTIAKLYERFHAVRSIGEADHQAKHLARYFAGKGHAVVIYSIDSDFLVDPSCQIMVRDIGMRLVYYFLLSTSLIRQQFRHSLLNVDDDYFDVSSVCSLF